MLLISIFRLKNTFKCFFFFGEKNAFGKIMKKPKKNTKSVFFEKHFERCFFKKKKHFNFFNIPIISCIPFKNQIIFS